MSREGRTQKAVRLVVGISFEREVLQAPVPVVVHFFTEGNEHCKALTPIFEEVAVDLRDGVKFVRVDAGRVEDIAARFKIFKIPTILILKNGKVVTKGTEELGRIVGVFPRAELKERISKALLAA
ncbi:MAG: thioredoxin [Parcubacteria group bacterium]|nr:thioredoxin [Parcubacteria group bacterium]